MHRACVLSVAFCFASVAIAQTTPDETAVRDLVQRYMDARNSKSADATRALFTADADQLVSTGEWRKGIDALVRGAMASSQKEAGNSTITVESVRFLDAHLAIVDGRYQTSARKMWTTIIVKQTESGWRIAAIRNMLPAANPGH